MKLTPELVKAIVKTCNQDERFSEEFTNKVSQVTRLEDKLKKVKKSKAELKEEYDRQLGYCNAIIKDIQKECPHYILDYESDPAGGSDSFDQCTICGLIS